MISTVVFDAVGTLLYADPPAATVYQAVAASAGWQGTAKQVSHRLSFAVQRRFGQGLSTSDAGNTKCATANSLEHEQHIAESDAHHYMRWKQVVADVFPELASRVAGEVFERLWIHFAQPQAWCVYDDVAVALQWCSLQNLRCAIASNFDSRLHHVMAGHSQLLDIPICTSCEMGAGKPSGQFFHAVSERLDVPVDELLMIGDDSVADYQGARQAGWTSLLLKRSTQFHVESEQISSLEGLPDWFHQYGSIHPRRQF